MRVRSVENSVAMCQHWVCTCARTHVSSRSNVQSADVPSVTRQISAVTREYTLGRGHISVTYVKKHSPKCHIWGHIHAYTPERGLMHVGTVARHTHANRPFMNVHADRGFLTMNRHRIWMHVMLWELCQCLQVWLLEFLHWLLCSFSSWSSPWLCCISKLNVSSVRVKSGCEHVYLLIWLLLNVKLGSILQPCQHVFELQIWFDMVSCL